VKDRFLQDPFNQVIIQRGSFLSQKKGQPLPVPLQIRERLAQARVRFHQPLDELPVDPLLQAVHHRFALLLVQP